MTGKFGVWLYVFVYVYWLNNTLLCFTIYFLLLPIITVATAAKGMSIICCTIFKFHGYNPLKAEVNRICHLLALLGARRIFHVSRMRVKVHLLKQITAQYQIFTNSTDNTVIRFGHNVPSSVRQLKPAQIITTYQTARYQIPKTVTFIFTIVRRWNIKMGTSASHYENKASYRPNHCVKPTFAICLLMANNEMHISAHTLVLLQ